MLTDDPSIPVKHISAANKPMPSPTKMLYLHVVHVFALLLATVDRTLKKTMGGTKQHCCSHTTGTPSQTRGQTPKKQHVNASASEQEKTALATNPQITTQCRTSRGLPICKNRAGYVEIKKISGPETGQREITTCTNATCGLFS